MMTTYPVKLVSLFICLALLSGCNDYFINTTQLASTTQQPLLVILFSSLFLIPLISLTLLIFSQWKHIQFRKTLQHYLHGSLILMLAIAWFIDLNYSQHTDSMMDLVLTLCALSAQMIVVVSAFVLTNKQQKIHQRAKNFM